MSQVLVSESNESENGQNLVDQLPPWMPKAPRTGNFKLLDAVGRAVDRLDDDIEAVDNASTVQQAETVAQLEQLAKLVDLGPKDGESKEKYRARTIAEFQKLTSEGTIKNLLENSAEILDVNTQAIEYKPEDENGFFTLGVPFDALQALSLTSSEFKEVIEDQAAAGFRIRAVELGTFDYITVTDYNNSNHDTNKAYTSDSDGDGSPDSGGGTYSGII